MSFVNVGHLDYKPLPFKREPDGVCNVGEVIYPPLMPEIQVSSDQKKHLLCRDDYRYSAELSVHSQNGTGYKGKTGDIIGHAAVGPLFFPPIPEPTFRADRYAVHDGKITFFFGKPGHGWLGFMPQAVNKRYQLKCTFSVSERDGDVWKPPVAIGESITSVSKVQDGDKPKHAYDVPPGKEINRYYKQTIIRALQQVPSLDFIEAAKEVSSNQEWDVILDCYHYTLRHDDRPTKNVNVRKGRLAAEEVEEEEKEKAAPNGPNGPNPPPNTSSSGSASSYSSSPTPTPVTIDLTGEDPIAPSQGMQSAPPQPPLPPSRSEPALKRSLDAARRPAGSPPRKRQAVPQHGNPSVPRHPSRRAALEAALQPTPRAIPHTVLPPVSQPLVLGSNIPRNGGYSDHNIAMALASTYDLNLADCYPNNNPSPPSPPSPPSVPIHHPTGFMLPIEQQFVNPAQAAQLLQQGYEPDPSLVPFVYAAESDYQDLSLHSQPNPRAPVDLTMISHPSSQAPLHLSMPSHSHPNPLLPLDVAMSIDSHSNYLSPPHLPLYSQQNPLVPVDQSMLSHSHPNPPVDSLLCLPIGFDTFGDQFMMDVDTQYMSNMGNAGTMGGNVQSSQINPSQFTGTLETNGGPSSQMNTTTSSQSMGGDIDMSPLDPILAAQFIMDDPWMSRNGESSFMGGQGFF
ncbi:hypothetical protein B0T10DRAFT_585716 [Thelonectria olida]|uniref:Uncharacterized protein n=1 Tax=Thelonectria olida TaxID=1576542 RepID=A0A9P8VU27_9HYPO|nr:hypothetical protein B0T10DRAFT_585716 [Thelonectria olida]